MSIDPDLLAHWLDEWQAVATTDDEAGQEAFLNTIVEAHREALAFSRVDDPVTARVANRTLDTIVTFYERVTAGVVDDMATDFVKDVEAWHSNGSASS